MGSRTWHWPGVLLGLLLTTAGAQADTLRVATLDWAPYVGPDLPGKGLASRILDEALALDGHRAELVFLPWQRALKEAAEGRFDALMPAYLSPERRELFHATIPCSTRNWASSASASACCRSIPRIWKACVRTASVWSAATSTGRISTPTAA